MGRPGAADEDWIASVRDLVVQLGTAMSAAGDSVDAIDETLRRIVAAYGVEHIEIAVLPTSLTVSTGVGTRTQIQIAAAAGRPLRFDQIAALYVLIRDASAARIEPEVALGRLADVEEMRPTFRWPVRTLGHAVMTVGLALLLQPTPGAVAGAFVLGALVGSCKLLRLAGLELIFPVAMAFVVSVIVFAVLQHARIDNPVRVLVPPLVTFLPGGALTIATVELAAGQMVSGASRLVSGLVQLLLLAFGILAAQSLFHLPPSVLADHPVDRLGWWAPWVGVVVFAIGIHLHLSSPITSLGWILALMLAAYAGQVAGAALFGGLLSGFFGAVVMTPLALWVDARPGGPPKLVTFLPAFWLLVPGAAGLLGLTELLGADGQFGAEAIADTLVTVTSIALGVLVGTAVFRALPTGVGSIVGPVDGPVPDDR